MFDSQGGIRGIKKNVSFFSNKRMAFYWIDYKDSSKNSISSAFYNEIDTIITVPAYRSLTYSSRLDVSKKNGEVFALCIDFDSITTYKFFNAALEEWKKHQ